MTNQSQTPPKEAQFKLVALWETYIIQLASKKVQVLDNDEISIIYLHMEKMELKYSCHWQYIFFPSGYWHCKKLWGSQTKNYGRIPTKKLLAKMKISKLNIAKLVNKTRSI